MSQRAPANYPEVHGLMSEADLIWLRSHARGACVELGSLEGMSAIAAASARAVKFVVCIDIFPCPIRFATFKNNILSFPILPLRGNSIALANLFEDDFFDFCFIDTDHTEETTTKELRAWLPKLKMGGTICGHDTNLPGVDGALKACLPWYEIEFSGIWSYTKT